MHPGQSDHTLQADTPGEQVVVSCAEPVVQVGRSGRAHPWSQARVRFWVPRPQGTEHAPVACQTPQVKGGGGPVAAAQVTHTGLRVAVQAPSNTGCVGVLQNCGHGVHAPGPAVALNVPAGQATQVLAPVAALHCHAVPSGQLLAVVALHGWHATAAAFVPSWYVPGAQGKHAPVDVGEQRPRSSRPTEQWAWHGWQGRASASSLYVARGQVTHGRSWLAPPWHGAPNSWPGVHVAVHAVQAIAAVLFLKVEPGQGTHAVVSATAPTAHVPCNSCPAAQEVWQARHRLVGGAVLVL